MGRYLLRRLLQAVPLLFFLSILVFLLIHIIPGGPADIYDNPNLDEAGRQALNASYGLDKPLYLQYLIWLKNIMTGDLGYSIRWNIPVIQLIAPSFGATIELFICALCLALVLAFLLGTISALRQGKSTDAILSLIAYLGISMPIFLLGLFMQKVFGASLQWLPASGVATEGVKFTPLDGFIDHLLHLLMPTLVLALFFTAKWSRYLRSSLIDVLHQDYMRTGRAKGLSSNALIWRHALRNAILPLVTIVALDLGAAAGGAAITEQVFFWPGMGRLFLSSLDGRDYPLLLSMLMVSGIFVIVFNLLADVLYGVMDPRIRYA